ncbi:hypothetical protein Tco_0241786 [Tanacetum coccineum]
MSSITAQQTKLDLEFVSKKNRLDIRKCNGRIPRGLTPREPTCTCINSGILCTSMTPSTDSSMIRRNDSNLLWKSSEISFRFAQEYRMHQPWRTFTALINRGLSGKTSGLDKLRLSRAQILWGMFYQKNVDYVELIWEDLIYQIDNRVHKKQEKIYYPRFTKVIIHHFLIQDKTLSWRNKIGMHTSKDDYLINSLRFVSAKESTQIYGAILPECLTSPVMKESKAYKTYLGYATGAVPPKMARKFKKASPSKKDSDLVPVDEEPVQKGKRVKRPAKKSTTKPAAGVVIREAPVETKSKSKEKEKVDVTRGKGIELLSEVALTEEAQMKEVRKKSLRDFHKTHPSGSGTVAKKPQSVDKITPTVTSEGTGDKPGVPDVTEDDSTESESESWGNDEDDNNNEQESSNEGSEQENESDEQESDSEQEEESEDDDQEEEEFVHTPTDDKDDDNLESESDDVIKSDEEKGMDDTTYQFDDDVDARLKEPTQTDKEVVQGEGADAEMNDAQQGNENLETTQEQVVEDAHVTISTIMKKTEVPITSSSRSSDLASKFLNFSDIPHADAEIVSPLDVHATMKSQELKSLTTRIKEQVKDQPPQILPKEVSNFASHVIKKLIKESRDEVTLAKVSYQPHSTYETASTLAEFELKKILIDKIEKSESYLAAPEHRDCYNSLKKSYDLDKNFFFFYDVYSLKRGRKDKDKDEDPSAGSDRGLKKRKTSKDAEPTTGPKNKDSTSSSSKGTKSQAKPSRKSVQSEEPVFELADSDMPQDQEGNLDDNNYEPRKEDASRRD